MSPATTRKSRHIPTPATILNKLGRQKRELSAAENTAAKKGHPYLKKCRISASSRHHRDQRALPSPHRAEGRHT
jgi:hypothetical protein